MNLHGIVAPIIGAVNPNVLVTVAISTGSTTNTDHTLTPTFATFNGVQAQVQPLSTKELRQVESLNLQGTMKAFYLYGAVAGVVRVSSKGGDLITMADGTVWLVTLVSEQWPDWCRVVGTLQNGA